MRAYIAFDQICLGAARVDGEGRETEKWEDGRWRSGKDESFEVEVNKWPSGFK